ncbi:type IV pilin protein [Desulfogranum japonicum]|uniref:type IV pilin protein n=1 Tax=Desulfogranum japonicum TaxID=231447 RepID=UPI000407E14C|nr:prepilin-type N-terminal cleavage/methylation domain-containing protein [Desulfogranum japonicum]
MNMKAFRKMKAESGFTLVELMIVVAIIGILAAIAVPQFMSYRLRSYNTAAKAVAHNLKADQANLNSELGVYGHTEVANLDLTQPDSGAAAADTVVDVALASSATAGAGGARLVGTTITATPRTLAIGVSLGTNMIAQAIDINDANLNSHYTLFTRHFRGDTAYGIDSDLDNTMFSVSNPNWPSAAGLQATPHNPGANTGGLATSVGDDIGGQGGNGLPTPTWAQM